MNYSKIQQVTPNTSFRELVYPRIGLMAIEEYLFDLRSATRNKFCLAEDKALFERLREETIVCFKDLAKVKDLSDTHRTLYTYLLSIRRMFHVGLNQPHYFLHKQAYLFELQRYCREGLVLVHELMGCN